MAGADGGPAYADWPRIGGAWVPSTAFRLEPIWRNFVEDHATQHLIHRTLGYAVALIAFVLGFAAPIRGRGAARCAGAAVGVIALLQAGLGVHALLSASALWPSLAHQAGAVALWTMALVLARAAWR